MTLAVNCMAKFASTVKLHDVSRPPMYENYCLFRGKSAGSHKPNCVGILLGKKIYAKGKRWSRIPSALDSDTSTESSNIDSRNNGKPLINDDFLGTRPVIPNAVKNVETNSKAGYETAEKDQSPSSDTQPTTPKTSTLTAREKLRAARVLSRFTESETRKPEMGSKVLDALRESDGGKARSGLPEAPTNLFDDSKRGMPKQGLTFDLPGGTDLFVIIFSFVFISTVMFGTTYIVWKVGAIHFNEY